MGKVKIPPPAKLICGMITQNEELFEIVSERLASEFGPIDYKSQILPFCHTSYYEAEMDKNLKRKFISFSQLIDKDRLPKIKLFTNALEEEFAMNNRRRINLDPGYLTLSKLVLATTKDHSHRLYLGDGIYGEVTLYYKDRGWRPYEWTYPDYRTKEYQEIFEEIRKILKETKTQVTS